MKNIVRLLFLCIFFSCGNKQNDFYSRKGGIDYIRVPLIEPYEAICTDKKNWGVNFIYTPLSSNGVTHVDIFDSIIIIIDSNSIKDTDRKNYKWCFIIPSQKVEARFNNRSLFQDSLSYFTNRKAKFKKIEDLWSGSAVFDR